MGSGPFKFTELRGRPGDQGRAQPRLLSQGIAVSRRVRLGYLCAKKQATRIDAIRGDRAASEFRGLPPSARDQLVKDLGRQDHAVQESDWNCANLITPNHKKKPFDDVRVRRALALALDQWKGAPALSKIANVDGRRHRLPGFATGRYQGTAREHSPGYWPDIEKSRAEAKRQLLKEAGAEGLSFELMNRNIDQPYKIVRRLRDGRLEQAGP